MSTMLNTLTMESAAQALQTFNHPYVLIAPHVNGRNRWHRGRLLDLRNARVAVVKPDGHKNTEEIPYDKLKLKVSGNESLRRAPIENINRRIKQAAVLSSAVYPLGEQPMDIKDQYERSVRAAGLTDGGIENGKLKVYGEPIEDTEQWLIVDTRNHEALLNNCWMSLPMVLNRIENKESDGFAVRTDAEKTVARIRREGAAGQHPDAVIEVLDFDEASELATTPVQTDPIPAPALPAPPDDNRKTVVDVPAAAAEPDKFPGIDRMTQAAQLLASIKPRMDKARAALDAARTELKQAEDDVALIELEMEDAKKTLRSLMRELGVEP